jgi:hypothetical protein
VKLHASGEVFTALEGWVIVGPPKFAPQIDNVITLYDVVFQMGVDQGWLTGPDEPSYTDDIFPILQRARDTGWAENVFGAHSWPDPVYDQAVRQAIFNRLANPAGGGSNMPQLHDATLTPTQYAVMQQWRDGNFSEDWAGPPGPAPTPSPDEIDRAALDHCVGAAFFPGIEAGGIAATPIINPSKYVGAADPMRLNHAVLSPGAMSEFMALPWQADFKACGSNWWPVPRPNWVIPQGASSRQAWDRDVGSYLDMVNQWHTLGFVVRQGSEHVEVDRCDATFIALLTPHLSFQDVPQGPMGMSRKLPLAISFEVRSPGAAVALEVEAGDGPAHPRLTLSAPSVTVGPTAGNQIATARLWVIYETGPVGESISDAITVQHLASGQSWTVSVTASTAPRKVAAAALVLDRSGSMLEDRGDGQSKYQSLKEAASIFVDVMLEGDSVALVRYNQDAQPLQAVTVLGPAGDPLDLARQKTKDIINGPDLSPSGATSIGDGIFEGRQLLNAAGAGLDVKALVVLTDGKENRPRWISDVAPEINERTYAVGLGTPENTSAPALQTLAGNNGGYLLVTGAIAGDNRFILQKYFLQILAGISNAEVVLDPNGELLPNREQRIPFLLTEADSGVDVILLTPYPKVVDFRLQTPNGFILEPWRALAEPAMRFVLEEGVSYYRLVLPTELMPARFDQAGTWHVLLNIGRPRLSRPDLPPDVRRPATDQGRDEMSALRRRIPPWAGRDPAEAAINAMMPQVAMVASRRTLPYSLLVHSYSNLSLRASLQQSGYEPGARATLEAMLTESGIPVEPGASVWAEILRPDGGRATLVLAEGDSGAFGGSFVAATSGVYHCRVRATGRSRMGYPFHREQSLTAAVWHGGDRDADPDNRGGGPLVRWLEERDHRLCDLLRCLLAERGVITPELHRRLAEAGLDIERLRRCFEAYCHAAKPAEEDIRDVPRGG